MSHSALGTGVPSESLCSHNPVVHDFQTMRMGSRLKLPRFSVVPRLLAAVWLIEWLQGGSMCVRSFQAGLSPRGSRLRRDRGFPRKNTHQRARDAAASRAPTGAERTWEGCSGGKLPTWLVERAQDIGYSHPSVVQATTLPTLMNGTDAVIQAHTGSGKTLAYLMPVIAGVDMEAASTQAIIVVPTRELGLQVSKVARSLTAARRILVMSLLEGSQNRRQRAWAWAEPPQVVVANPGPLETMLANGGLRIDRLRFVVVDEVDACASMPHTRDALHKVLGRYLSHSYTESALEDNEDVLLESLASLRVAVTGVDANKGMVLSSGKLKDRQSIFLSASIPQPRQFLRQCVQRGWCIDQPVWHNVGANDVQTSNKLSTSRTPPQLQHRAVLVDPKHKLLALRRYLENEFRAGVRARAIVFCNPDRPLEDMAAYLEAHLEEFVESRASAVGVLFEDAGLNKRAKVMEEFRSGVSCILLATDLAARGLDIPETTHVVQFDMPASADLYLHRAGRTARMGRAGTVLTLASPQEGFVVERLGNSLGVEVDIRAPSEKGKGQRRT